MISLSKAKNLFSRIYINIKKNNLKTSDSSITDTVGN